MKNRRQPADVGWSLRVRGDLAAAEEFYRETLVRRARAFGEDHPLTIRSRWQVSRLLVDQAKFEDGEEFARTALEAARRVLPEGNDNLTSTLVFWERARSASSVMSTADAQPA